MEFPTAEELNKLVKEKSKAQASQMKRDPLGYIREEIVSCAKQGYGFRMFYYQRNGPLLSDAQAFALVDLLKEKGELQMRCLS